MFLIKIPYIEVNQPIGTFYISKINAHYLINYTTINRRTLNNNGIQRALNNEKVKKIGDYCNDPDATFPTPIILSINSKDIDIDETTIIFKKDYVGEIIDGQHRVNGLALTNNVDNFELPIILMLDLDQSEKAYIFSVINSNQTPVPKSLIYELFELSDKKNVYKTAHEIARGLNSDADSSFYNKLKMLGKKEHDNNSLSQGTFVTYLVKLYSKHPDRDNSKLKKDEELISDSSLPLRSYFIKDRQDVMYKVIRNYFNAVQKVFPEEWSNHQEYILSKSTGYGALILVFPYAFQYGKEKNKLNESIFEEFFKEIKSYFDTEGIKLTANNFPSNAQQQRKLADRMIEPFKNNIK